jgi:dolichol kinase
VQFRKVIHISGTFIPFLAGDNGIGKYLTMALILLGFIVYLIIEVFKLRISRDILSLVYRENELTGFSIEPISYLLSVLSLLSFSFYIDEKLCYAAIAVLAAGDGFAGVIGRRYGRHRFWFSKNKSWEGTLSGFIAASISGFYYAGPIALAGSFFGMIAGAINKNDNITVPFSALISMFVIRYACGGI